MGFRLIVAEKPSVARDIARVLGVDGRRQGSLGGGATRISWCLGHLVELAEPSAYDAEWRAWRLETLPLIPTRFRLVPRASSKDQWDVLRRLLADPELDDVVNACDAGREGELIFANAYAAARCRAPIRRLWISSMTDAAIREGFERLRPGEEFLDLEAAARCRSEADWLVGINATRAMTLRARQAGATALLSLGRVQTPTLALLVERELAIEAFVPETFWQVRARFGAEPGEWEATWCEVLADGSRRDRLDALDKARAIVARVEHRPGVVRSCEGKTARERPPLLYDLTTLQKEANARHGFSAQKTLSLAQSLYERHKVLTYPRTDARHLGSDLVESLPQRVDALTFGPYEAVARGILDRWPIELGPRVIDDAEVSDHHAIIPTGLDPRRAELEPDEKKVFDLVARRFLAVFEPDAVFSVVVLDTAVGDDLFSARGRTCLEPGWQAIDPPRTRAGKKTAPDRRGGKDAAPTTLPLVEAGQEVRGLGVRVHEGATKPPKRFTEATLLGAMERAGEALEDAELKRAMKRNGLGTPATRAAIIETLLARSYVERAKAQLVPTAQGRALVAALPVAALRSPKLTGEWEARLVAIAEGREPREEFMAGIRRMTAEVVESIRGAEIETASLGALSETAPAEGEPLGDCPRCGGEVREGRRGWSCGGCRLLIPSSIARREVSRRMALALLKRGHTEPVKGFKSKKGRDFRAALRLDSDGKVAFEFPGAESLGACPACGTDVRRRGRAYTCESGRDCPFVVFAEISGRQIAEDEVRTLLEQGRTPRLTGFRKKDGTVFKAGLELGDDHRVRLRFDAPREERPLPPGAPPPAFDRRVDCPACVARAETQPGYVVAGREAWGCSRWRDGCKLRVPFVLEGQRLRDDDAVALFTGKRRTRYLKGLHGDRGQLPICRVVLVPDAEPCWRLEPKRRPAR